MLKQITCHIIVCDDCGDEYETGASYTPHFQTDKEAEEEINGTGWWFDNGRHLCEDCASKPHAFVPDENYPDECARCWNPAHAPAGEAVQG